MLGMDPGIDCRDFSRPRPVASRRMGHGSVIGCNSEQRTRHGPRRNVHMTNPPSSRRRPSVHITLQRAATAASPGPVPGREPADARRDPLPPGHRPADVLPRARIAQAVRREGPAQGQAVHAHGDGRAGRGPAALSRSPAQLRRDGRTGACPARPASGWRSCWPAVINQPAPAKKRPSSAAESRTGKKEALLTRRSRPNLCKLK